MYGNAKLNFDLYNLKLVCQVECLFKWFFNKNFVVNKSYLKKYWIENPGDVVVKF